MIKDGQICLAVERPYMPEAIYDEVCDELEMLAGQAVVDDGLKQRTQFGPLQNRMQYETVKEMISDAVRRGARISGGELLDGPGLFIRPAIVRDLDDDDARLVREEQFGPVLPVLRYADVDDAFARANDTDPGLGGMWGENIDRAVAVAGRLETGIVLINARMDVNPLLPMGGARL